MAARSRFLSGLLIALVLTTSLQGAAACPFCSAVGQTLSQEMASMEAVVVAKLTKSPPAADLTGGPGSEIPKATFEVLEVLKGTNLVDLKAKIETIYIGRAAVGTTFLITAVGPEKLLWSTPVQLTDKSVEFLRKLPTLPKEGAERLAFFQDYLESEDPLLNRDAYDEFANAPYQDLIDLKPKMNHDQLITWIKDVENITPSKRRLYLTMLGVCGSEADLPLLEKYISSKDRKDKNGLDALIASYLQLKGNEGLDLVDKLFLKNADADFAETYTAVMALRFHSTESEVLAPERIVKSLRLMLDRANLADLVIPDLARLEDWDSADKLMELYRRSDEQTGWVRVPIVQFLRVCPEKDKADKLLKECEKIDPQSVEKAKTFLPLGGRPATTPMNEKATSMPVPAKGEVRRISAEIDAGNGLQEVTSGAAAAKRKIASANLGAAPAEAVVTLQRRMLNPWAMVGVPGVIGCMLMLAQWRLLCGAGKS